MSKEAFLIIEDQKSVGLLQNELQKLADKTGVEFTISLGLRYSGSNLEEAVFKADTALYRSKEQGGRKNL